MHHRIRPSLVVVFCAVTLGLALVAVLHQRSLAAQTAPPACGATGLSSVPVHHKDPFKHHALPVTGTNRGAVTSQVQWCDKDSMDVFIVSFKNDSPSPDSAMASTPNASATPPTNCTTAEDINQYSQSGTGFDDYEYTITFQHDPPIDPHIIVVGGSGGKGRH